MGVTGNLKVTVKLSNKVQGDVFHDLFGSTPHHVSTIVPDHIHACDLHEGDFGDVGSVIQWEYTLVIKMGVTSNLEVTVNLSNKVQGDVFHDLFGSTPHHVSTIVPDHIHACDLHEGDFGDVGSVIQWEYTLVIKMGVTSNLEVTVNLSNKVQGDVFHDLFGSTPHHVSTIVPDHIHACDLHEGDFGDVGSVIQWEYTLDGKKRIAKVAVEAVDEEKKIVIYKVIEGSDMLKDYKSVTVTIHVLSKGDHDTVIWSMEFEKFEDIGPYPTDLMDFAITVTRGIEAHHVNTLS